MKTKKLRENVKFEQQLVRTVYGDVESHGTIIYDDKDRYYLGSVLISCANSCEGIRYFCLSEYYVHICSSSGKIEAAFDIENKTMLLDSDPRIIMYNEQIIVPSEGRSYHRTCPKDFEE